MSYEVVSTHEDWIAALANAARVRLGAACPRKGPGLWNLAGAELALCEDRGRAETPWLSWTITLRLAA